MSFALFFSHVKCIQRNTHKHTNTPAKDFLRDSIGGKPRAGTLLEIPIAEIFVISLFFQQDRRLEDGMKYSSLESRLLGDVFKSTLDNDSSYDSKLGLIKLFPLFLYQNRLNWIRKLGPGFIELGI